MRCIFRLHFFLYIGSVDPYHRVSCSAQPISIDVGNLCLTAYSAVTTANSRHAGKGPNQPVSTGLSCYSLIYGKDLQQGWPTCGPFSLMLWPSTLALSYTSVQPFLWYFFSFLSFPSTMALCQLKLCGRVKAHAIAINSSRGL